MRWIATLSLIITSWASTAQTSIRWADLEQVGFEEFYDRDRSEWSMQASFSESVRDLNGVEIEITGYTIPLDVSGEVYVLSAFAFSSCFFCGGAGPESVMGLNFKESPDRLNTDDVIAVRGTLRLNRNPGLEFHYMLDNVELIRRY
ncbi:MAG: DUF3299 domain-containing protein [Flavobacteriia bacterium]|nr:DUF3299 domain-containing protein [Flavobacteriia bacterium]